MHFSFPNNELVRFASGRRQTVPPVRKAVIAGITAMALFAAGFITAPQAQAIATCSTGSTFEITTEASLRVLATDATCLEATKTFTLLNNITLSGSWTPIGNATNKFKGTFDGNSKTISGLSMALSANYGGLFGYAQNATIKNITLTGVSITNSDRTDSGPEYVGGIVGYADNTDLLNVSVSGSIDAVNSVGGVAGRIVNGSLIRNAGSVGTVGSDYSLSYVGGIVGYSSGSSIETVSSSATVRVQVSPITFGRPGGAGAGGIVGDAYSTNISEAEASGDVYGLQRTGGLAGSFVSRHVASGGSFSISDSYATGDVSGPLTDSECIDIGGLVGEVILTTESGLGAATVSIVNSFAAGSVTGNYRVGGAIGRAYLENDEGAASTLQLSGVHATGDVVGGTFVGGLVGRFNRSFSVEDDVVSITDAYATGATTGTTYVGGLVGSLAGGAIAASYATGAVTGNGSVGGLLGVVEGGSITTSYATGTVAGAAIGSMDGWNAGGLVGVVMDEGSIDQSYATGAVTGLMRVGSLAGELDGPSSGTAVSVTNSYATGSATAAGFVSGATREAYVGGLVGIYRDQVTVTNTYFAGAVSAAGGGIFAGAISGESFGTMTAISTYWNAETTGYSYALGTSDNVGTSIANTSPLTTSQMRNPASFSGWNFSTVWGYECAASNFPQLRAINTNATAATCVAAAAAASPEPATPTTAPTPSIGGSTMNIGGRVITVSTQPTSGNTGLTLNAGPVTMGLGGITADGRPLPIGPGGVLGLAIPGQLIVNASGLQAGSTVTQTLYSDPMSLGTVAVDATGSFRASPTIPASVPLGNHTLSFTGTANTGEAFTLNIGIRVQSQSAALGANPRLASKPKWVKPGVTALVAISAAQARCTVRFRAPDMRVSQRTSKNGVAQVELRVPTTQRKPWTVTASVAGTGCEPVTTSLTVPVRR